MIKTTVSLKPLMDLDVSIAAGQLSSLSSGASGLFCEYSESHSNFTLLQRTFYWDTSFVLPR